jgi:tripartite-type tricarboxylate transporter receptor subunit TctC
MARILVAADITERFFQLGAEAAPGAPEELADFVRGEVAKWQNVTRQLNIKAE